MRWLTQRLPLFISWPIVRDSVGLYGAKFTAARSTALGYAVILRLEAPMTAVVLADFCDSLAVAYGAARVRVEQDETHAHHVTLLIDYRVGIGTIPYQPEFNPIGLPLDPQRPLPIGLDDNGELVTIPLYGKHALIGGNPGAGKSVATRVLLAGLATSRNVSIVGIDPKRTELVLWRSRFDRLILGNGVEEVQALLTDLLDEIQRRAHHLSQMGSATLKPSSEFPWIVLVIDEWAELAADGDTKQRAVVNQLLRRCLSLGRAVGCTAILCTQRPTSDTVDTGARALTTYRFALKCGDKYQAEAILGVGTFAPGQLKNSSPGRALWSEGGSSQVVQFFNISDEEVSSLTSQGCRTIYEMPEIFRTSDC